MHINHAELLLRGIELSFRTCFRTFKLWSHLYASLPNFFDKPIRRFLVLVLKWNRSSHHWIIFKWCLWLRCDVFVGVIAISGIWGMKLVNKVHTDSLIFYRKISYWCWIISFYKSSIRLNCFIYASRISGPSPVLPFARRRFRFCEPAIERACIIPASGRRRVHAAIRRTHISPW